MKFSGKIYFKIISRKTRVSPPLRGYIFRKTTGGGQIDPPPSRFRVNASLNVFLYEQITEQASQEVKKTFSKK